MSHAITIDVQYENSRGGITKLKVKNPVTLERMLELIKRYADDPRLITLDITIVNDGRAS